MPIQPPPFDSSVQRKHVRARNEAVWIVVAGAILHILGLFGSVLAPLSWRLGALLFVMFGALLVFGGLMGLYTYYENIEERSYFPDKRVGVGSGMEARRPH